jgi:dienelactone hydrolase
MKQFDWRVSRLVGLSVLTLVHCAASAGAETFTPYAPGAVPQTVTDLWKDYDARKEPLDIEVVKEWQADGVVSRYVLFTVGIFKGTPARMAAYYTFPDDGQKHPAFVWSHGGGQRAERSRGVSFARQGYATVDINWLGRPLEDGIDANTDWGKVDPTQGPQFYPKALRQSWKLNLQPDEHTIDPVASPRNSNWFLLTVAGRRAITFLEQQPEVDAERIGFSGYSMGGMITALTAIDSRLKAVVPFVGGTGFKHVDFPDVEGSSLRLHLKDPDLYHRTIDASGYWPLVRCPVCFISSSNDFHAAFDRIYRSMALLKHPHWRVSTNIHQNHGPGPEQWVLLTMWFDQYLKGSEQRIPVTPPSTMVVSATQASFRVTPADQDRLVATEVYFSYDPNPLTRFWTRADATRSGGTWSVDLPIHADLPLYVFAICRYRLPEARQLERGETSTFVLNSLEQLHLPPAVRRAALANLATKSTLFEDFRHGVGDWSSRDGRSITTYKFQNPAIERSNGKKLVFTIDPHGKSLTLRLHTDSKFLGRADNQGSFSVSRPVRGESPQRIVISREDFKGPEGETLEWAKIATFQVTLDDPENRAKIPLAAEDGQAYLQAIELVD